MSLYDEIKGLLPGDKEFGVPAFSLDMYEELQRNVNIFKKIEDIFLRYELSESIDGTVRSENLKFIEFLKRFDIELYKKFRFQIINIYLTGIGFSELRKNAPYSDGVSKALPDIDYEVLEPVMFLGSRWKYVSKVQ